MDKWMYKASETMFVSCLLHLFVSLNHVGHVSLTLTKCFSRLTLKEL